MVITFTLQSLYSGTTYVAGPFNISGVTNTGTVTELAANVSKATLLTGVTISNISDATTGGTITSLGTCSNSISWSVTGTSSNPTTVEYTDGGAGSTVGEACNDAVNNRTYYSDCPTQSFGTGCYVYLDSFGSTPLTGYNFVYINGATWDISPVTGLITAYSTVQC